MQQTSTPTGIEVRNWGGDVASHPQVLVRPRSVDELVAVVRDRERYPSPVRAVGSNHSTTRCATADGGTVVDMSGMNRVLAVGDDYVTAEAGALYVDVAKLLERHGRQFHVNVELGNLSIGSACCGGTKDASMPGEYGQVCSYAIAMRLVMADGSLLEVTESEPELLQAMRSGHGLLGIVYEATLRIRPLQAMALHHVTYGIDEFGRRLPELVARGESMMLYLYPFLGAVTVEYRRYVPVEGRPNRWSWPLRNWVWKTVAPLFGYTLTRHLRWRALRNLLLRVFNRLTQLALRLLIRGRHTVPTDQIIRYPAVSGRSRYTFSIWAFPEARYMEVLRAYYAFCEQHQRDTGYRCDLLNVGYRILADQSSLLSYSWDGDVMTVDPVSTGAEGWDEFLQAYNRFCSDRGGVPLFNQSKWLEPDQVRRAFGERLERFEQQRRRLDPDDRLLNPHFARLLERPQPPVD